MLTFGKAFAMTKFITNHGLVLLQIILGGDATVAKIADEVNISEQATHAIVRQLEDEGLIRSYKSGRRKTYRGGWVKGFSHEQQGWTLRDTVTALAALAGIMTAPKARVLLHVAENPNCSLTGIAKQTRLTRDEARSALDELEESGFLLRQQKRGKTTFAISSDVRPQHGRLLSPIDEIALVRRAKVQIPDPLETLDRILEGLRQRPDA